ncbi:pro-sigmaK processing inhibitor BofA family protein [Haloplasma contractile]|uniref:SigmaK-factor processing regulatory BofA protein n=1 Tax=Haloplasma contractile SSD-17B TaxID=1033810 RepID=F7PSI9_9MOLU|nr:pro-sigmaK processing inhibitor BofA family protein [Haloplasma contractile]ERJ12620.1 SigmaK-factor processing regulatory BofA protein [Haloplasma contractile SSD-17B]
MLKNIKWVLKNLVIGLVMIYVINMLTAYIEIELKIPINIATIFIAGFLRFPGLIIMFIIASL